METYFSVRISLKKDEIYAGTWKQVNPGVGVVKNFSFSLFIVFFREKREKV